MRTTSYKIFGVLLFSCFAAIGQGAVDEELIEVEPVGCEYSDSADVPILVPEKFAMWKKCDTSMSNKQVDSCTREAIGNHLSEKFKLPRKKINGKIYVQFAVNKLGKVDQIKILKGMNEQYDKAAIKAIQSLPNFFPAIYDGKKVSMIYVIPFEITNK